MFYYNNFLFVLARSCPDLSWEPWRTGGSYSLGAGTGDCLDTLGVTATELQLVSPRLLQYTLYNFLSFNFLLLILFLFLLPLSLVAQVRGEEWRGAEYLHTGDLDSGSRGGRYRPTAYQPHILTRVSTTLCQ